MFGIEYSVELYLYRLRIDQGLEDMRMPLYSLNYIEAGGLMILRRLRLPIEAEKVTLACRITYTQDQPVIGNICIVDVYKFRGYGASLIQHPTRLMLVLYVPQ